MLVGMFSSGCTLIGAGVGAGIDAAASGPYEIRTAGDRKQLERGDTVAVVTRAGATIRGKYRGRHGPTPLDPETYLLVEGSDRLEAVRSSDVAWVAVEIDGKGWLYGGLAGAAVDTVLVAGLIVAMNHTTYDGSGWGYGGGW